MSLHTKQLLIRGYTFIELLVVMAIVGMLALIAAVAFKNINSQQALSVTSQTVYNTVIRAQNDTLASQNNSAYGVAIATSSVTYFRGSIYDPLATTNVVTYFLGSVTASSSITDGSNQIRFNRLTGTPVASGTINIFKKDGTATETIMVHASGLIEI